jgi:hypothetical protein
VVVDKKARAFVKMTKTRQFRQPALPRAFTGEKHEIARAFYAKYDPNYGLWRNSKLQPVTFIISIKKIWVMSP